MKDLEKEYATQEIKFVITLIKKIKNVVNGSSN